MSSITISTTLDQDAALVALSPDGDGPSYLQARVADLLAEYVRQHRINQSPVTAEQGVAAFLAATPAQQQAALVALGLEPSA